MTVKTQNLKTYKMQQKQFQEGSLQQHNPTSKKTRKTSNRQPNFTPKTTGKRRTKKPSKLDERNHKISEQKYMKKKLKKNNSKD